METALRGRWSIVFLNAGLCLSVFHLEVFANLNLTFFMNVRLSTQFPEHPVIGFQARVEQKGPRS